MSDTPSSRSAYARLLDRALRILAMRDHSEQELRRKLLTPVISKGELQAVSATAEDIENVIAWCYQHQYLDDGRFVGQFINSRSRKGYGPQRIRQELSQKGISREMAEQVLLSCDIDWCALAREQAVRKFGDPLPLAFADKVKIQRFLLYRGFLSEDIQTILRNFTD